MEGGNGTEQMRVENILSRMSSSLSLDTSNTFESTPDIDPEPQALKTIPVEKDGNIGKLFIHSSHVLSEAEQILLEYLDQPKSKNSSKCSKIMEVKYSFSILSLDGLLEILENRHKAHLRNDQCKVHFDLMVDPSTWGPDKIFFQTCDNLDELILVVRFIIKHNLQVSGKLVAIFYR